MGCLMQGYVSLRPEDDEDMWHLYNLIQQVTQEFHYYREHRLIRDTGRRDPRNGYQVSATQPPSRFPQ
jgi:stalled ribosome rescue protein Dom34